MPGFDSHYVFGLDSLHHLPDGYVKKCCKHFPKAYALGNQGPDSFFFFSEAIFHKIPLGRILHTSNTGDFLSSLYAELRKVKNRKTHAILTAYIAGFYGHYAFDSSCHPFIYGRTNYDETDSMYSIRHAVLETDIDHILVKEHLHTTPSKVARHRLHWLSFYENRAISSLLMKAAYHTYPTISAFQKMKPFDLYIMPLTWAPMKNASGRQKKCFQFFEKVFHLKPTMSSQIYEEKHPVTKDPMNRKNDVWVNPYDATLVYQASFDELYEKGQEKHLHLLLALENHLLQKKKTFPFEESLSYLSGLPSDHLS